MNEKRTNGLEFGVGLDHLSLMEQRDEGLVGRLDEHELKGIVVEGDALESLEDGAESGTAGNYETRLMETSDEMKVLTHCCQHRSSESHRRWHSRASQRSRGLAQCRWEGDGGRTSCCARARRKRSQKAAS